MYCTLLTPGKPRAVRESADGYGQVAIWPLAQAGGIGEAGAGTRLWVQRRTRSSSRPTVRLLAFPMTDGAGSASAQAGAPVVRCLSGLLVAAFSRQELIGRRLSCMQEDETPVAVCLRISSR